MFSLTESFSSNLYFFVQITKLFSSWIKSTIVNHSNLSIPFNCESPERETQLSNRRNWEKHNDEHQTQTYASGISTSKAHNSTNNPSYKLVLVSLEKEFNLLHHPTYNSVMPNLISLFLRTFAIIYCTVNENVTVCECIQPQYPCTIPRGKKFVSYKLSRPTIILWDKMHTFSSWT